MIEDCFEKWYSKTYPDLDPIHDDFYQHLYFCYKSAWKRSLEVDKALTELAKMAQENSEYD